MIDGCAFPVLFIPLIFLRDLLLPDSCMCTYVNYYLDGSSANSCIRIPVTVVSGERSLDVMKLNKMIDSMEEFSLIGLTINRLYRG